LIKRTIECRRQYYDDPAPVERIDDAATGRTELKLPIDEKHKRGGVPMVSRTTERQEALRFCVLLSLDAPGAAL
jgi:hypothetical protein